MSASLASIFARNPALRALNADLVDGTGCVAAATASKPTIPTVSPTPAHVAPKGGGKRGDGQSRMTKEEARYKAVLDAKLAAGEIRAYGFETCKLRLGHNTSYTPDFEVVTLDGRIEFHETKGAYIYEDALVKFKVAASMRPWNRFLLIQSGTVKYDLNDPAQEKTA